KNNDDFEGKPRSNSSKKSLQPGKPHKKPGRKSRSEKMQPSPKVNVPDDSDNGDVSGSLNGDDDAEYDTDPRSTINQRFGPRLLSPEIYQGPTINFLKRPRIEHEIRPTLGHDTEYHKMITQKSEATYNRFSSLDVQEAVRNFFHIWDSNDLISFNDKDTYMHAILEELILVPPHAFSACTILSSVDPITSHKLQKYGLFATTSIPKFHLVHEIKGTISSTSDIFGRGSGVPWTPSYAESKWVGISWIEKNLVTFLPPFVFKHPSFTLNDISTPSIFPPGKFPKNLFVDAREYASRDGRFIRSYCGYDKKIENSVCNAVLKSVIVMEDDPDFKLSIFSSKESHQNIGVENGGCSIVLNNRIRLTIFTTKPISPGEELVLRNDNGFLNYPCICEDNPECLASVSADEWEKQTNMEKQRNLLEKGLERDRLKQEELERKNRERDLEYDSEEKEMDIDIKSVIPLIIDDANENDDDENQNTSKKGRRKESNRKKKNRSEQKEIEMERESSPETETTHMRLKKRRPSGQTPEAEQSTHFNNPSRMSREDRKIFEEIARIERMEKKEMARREKKKGKEERDKDKDRKNSKKKKPRLNDEEEEEEEEPDEDMVSQKKKDLPITSESVETGEISIVGSTFTSAIQSRANTPILENPLEPKSQKDFSSTSLDLIESALWDQASRDDDIFVVEEEGIAGEIHMSTPTASENIVTPQSSPNQKTDQITKNTETETTPDATVRKVSLHEFLLKKEKTDIPGESKHESNQEESKPIEMPSEEIIPPSNHENFENKTPEIQQSKEISKNDYFPTTFPVASEIFSSVPRQLPASPPPQTNSYVDRSRQPSQEPKYARPSVVPPSIPGAMIDISNPQPLKYRPPTFNSTTIRTVHSDDTHNAEVSPAYRGKSFEKEYFSSTERIKSSPAISPIHSAPRHHFTKPDHGSERIPSERPPPTPTGQFHKIQQEGKVEFSTPVERSTFLNTRGPQNPQSIDRFSTKDHQIYPPRDPERSVEHYSHIDRMSDRSFPVERLPPADRRFYDRPTERLPDRPPLPMDRGISQRSSGQFGYPPPIPSGRGRAQYIRPDHHGPLSIPGPTRDSRDWDRDRDRERWSDWDRRERWDKMEKESYWDRPGFIDRRRRSRSPDSRRLSPPIRRWAPSDIVPRPPPPLPIIRSLSKDQLLGPRSPPYSYNYPRRPRDASPFDRPYDPANPDGIEFDPLDEDIRSRIQRHSHSLPLQDPNIRPSGTPTREGSMFRDRDADRDRDRGRDRLPDRMWPR
ncbi:hypothetical protein HK096_001864, partial [Nowakowskiella sp. JEL0078]